MLVFVSGCAHFDLPASGTGGFLLLGTCIEKENRFIVIRPRRTYKTRVMLGFSAEANARWRNHNWLPPVAGTVSILEAGELVHRFPFDQGTITETNWLPPDSNKVAYVLKMSEILDGHLRSGKEYEVYITFAARPVEEVTAWLFCLPRGWYP